MKSKIVTQVKEFQPIEVNLTIESLDELRCLLTLAQSFNFGHLMEEICSNSTYDVSGQELADFIDNMISADDFESLCEAYKL